MSVTAKKACHRLPPIRPQGSAMLASAASQLPAPEPILDDDGFEQNLDIGEQLDQEKIDHDKYSRLAQKLDDIGWLPLVEAAYADEKLSGSEFMRDCSDKDWLMAADELLCTVPTAVLKAICFRDGNLPDVVEGNQPLKTTLERYAKRADEQASVYIRALTVGGDEYNRLSVDDAETLAGHALHYAHQHDDHAEAACTIDRAFQEKPKTWQRYMSDQGKRFYLKTPKSEIDSSRKRRLLTFARVLQRTVYDCRSRDEHYVPTMHYVGYAIKASTRKAQHEAKGGSTNWLCVFVQAVLTAMKLEPTMSTYTVCLINEHWNGPVAEMLLTRLSRAYYFAGGFSIAQAGASMNSIKLSNLDEDERNRVWQECVEWVTKKTDYRSIQDKEIRARERLKFTRRQEEKKVLRQNVNKYERRLEATEELCNAAMVEMQADEALWEAEFPEEREMLLDIHSYVSSRKKELADIRERE